MTKHPTVKSARARLMMNMLETCKKKRAMYLPHFLRAVVLKHGARDAVQLYNRIRGLYSRSTLVRGWIERVNGGIDALSTDVRDECAARRIAVIVSACQSLCVSAQCKCNCGVVFGLKKLTFAAQLLGLR